MPSYLVHFRGQQHLLGNSHIVELPKAPSTQQAFASLRSTLAEDRGIKREDIIILAWSFMPDADTHPTKIKSYGYFMTYDHASGCVIGSGHTGFEYSKPICTVADLRDVEEIIRSNHKYNDVRLVTCTATEQ